jgi:hypothetical protein
MNGRESSASGSVYGAFVGIACGFLIGAWLGLSTIDGPATLLRAPMIIIGGAFFGGTFGGLLGSVVDLAIDTAGDGGNSLKAWLRGLGLAGSVLVWLILSAWCGGPSDF